MSIFGRPTRNESYPGPPVGEARLLFLDDDPGRAEVFLHEHPQAIWVKTAPECVAKLEEPWDEVHLDHDLGGEQFVDDSREDCGMEVVRWLCLFSRPHLKKTRFLIHSHNPSAATMMAMQMMMNGYRVEVRPFGSQMSVPTALRSDVARRSMSPLAVLGRLVRRLLGRSTAEDYGYSEPAAPGGLPVELFDFSWRPPVSTDSPDGPGPDPTAPRR